MKFETFASEKAQLCTTALKELEGESNAIDYGNNIM